MLIVIAWTVPDFIVIDSTGLDLGRRPVLEECRVPRAVVWTLEGRVGDLERAKQHAAEQLSDYPDARVLIAPEACSDPLRWAKSEIMKTPIPS